MSTKTFLHQVKRLCYRLVCWINYPTSRERMWHMYACGKAQGIKEALKTLPITQVQPAVRKVVIHPPNLPPGVLTRQWLDEHRAAIPSQPAYWPAPFEAQMIKSGKNGHENGSGLASEATSGQLINDAWLNSKPPVKASLPDTTEEMPAVVKLLHERKYATRKLE